MINSQFMNDGHHALTFKNASSLFRSSSVSGLWSTFTLGSLVRSWSTSVAVQRIVSGQMSGQLELGLGI